MGKALELQRRDSERAAMTLDQIKTEHINEVIAGCGGNLSAAAQRLGVNRQTLYNLLKKK